MGSGPRVDGKGLGVADVGQVGDQLEAVDDLAASSTSSLHTEAQDAAKAALEILLGDLMGRVIVQAGV